MHNNLRDIILQNYFAIPRLAAIQHFCQVAQSSGDHLRGGWGEILGLSVLKLLQGIGIPPLKTDTSSSLLNRGLFRLSWGKIAQG